MKIGNLEQMAQTTPREFSLVKGFGKKCLREVAETLEKYYSSLDINRLTSFANRIELWRPYFPHPERVPVVLSDPDSPIPSQLVTNSNGQSVLEPIEQFYPTQNLQAQLLVQDLPISVRARHVLKIANIRTLNDLAQTHPCTLFKIKNCGRTTIAELGILLRGFFTSISGSGMVFYRKTMSGWLRHAAEFSDNRSGPMILLQPEMQTVVEVIETTLLRSGDRRSSILTKRMGLSRGESRRTLEAIGREFHLTRERVRQIVDAALKLILRNLKTCRPDVYENVLNLIQAHGVVSLDEVTTAIPNLGSSMVFDEKASVRMLLIANRGEFQRLDPSGNVWGSKELTLEFSKVLKAAHAVLKGIPMPCEHVSLEVARSLRQFEDGKIRAIQKLLLSPSGQFRVEVSADGPILHPPRQTSPDRRRAFIYAYIKEQGVPVHIQEIFSALQDSEPELIPDSPTRRAAIQTITNSIDRDDRFAWAGMSTWGLREWGYVSRGKSVAAAALELLRASSIPLSTAQIRKELSNLYRVTPSAVNAALT